MEPRKLKVTQSACQSQESAQSDSAFKSFPSAQPRAASAVDNNRGRLSSSKPSLPPSASLGRALKLLQHSQNPNGFCQMNQEPLQLPCCVPWILKTRVSRAVNLSEAGGGSEEKSTDGDQCCHVRPNENCKKPFWWAIVQISDK